MNAKLTREEDWDEFQEELLRLRKAAGQKNFRFDPFAVRERVGKEILDIETHRGDYSTRIEASNISD